MSTLSVATIPSSTPELPISLPIAPIGLELEGKEAWQLQSLAKVKTIDKGLEKSQESSVFGCDSCQGWRTGIPLRRNLQISKENRQTLMEAGIQYLRELAMVKVISNNLDDDQASKDLHEIQCTQLCPRRQPPP